MFLALVEKVLLLGGPSWGRRSVKPELLVVGEEYAWSTILSISPEARQKAVGVPRN